MLLSEAETNNKLWRNMVSHFYAFRGRRTYACEEIHHTEPGRSKTIARSEPVGRFNQSRWV